jgi:hypothetical protein
MKETQLVYQIYRAYFHQRWWICLDRANSGTFKVANHYVQGHETGTADLIGFMAPFGRFVVVEAKVGKNKQSPEQKEYQERVERLGGVYILAYFLSDVEAVLKPYYEINRALLLNKITKEDAIKKLLELEGVLK